MIVYRTHLPVVLLLKELLNILKNKNAKKFLETKRKKKEKKKFTQEIIF